MSHAHSYIIARICARNFMFAQSHNTLDVYKITKYMSMRYCVAALPSGLPAPRHPAGQRRFQPSHPPSHPLKPYFASRRARQRCRVSNAPTAHGGRVARANQAQVHVRQALRVEAGAAHVQPLGAGLAASRSAGVVSQDNVTAGGGFRRIRVSRAENHEKIRLTTVSSAARRPACPHTRSGSPRPGC